MSVDQEQRFYPELEIVKRDVPCWYELSWKKNPRSLVLKIHQDFLQNSQSISSDAPIVNFLAEKFKMAGFGGDFSKDIGFENIFKNKGLDERKMVIYQAEIPEVKKITQETCSHCHGTKHDADFGHDCLYCERTGKEILMDWKPAYAFSASLTVLTSYLRFPKKETSANFPQLLILETITDQDMHGGSLSGVFSLRFQNYLKLQTREALEQIIVPTTKTAYEKMLGKRDSVLWKYSFGILRLESGGLCINCPGDACGVHPDTYAEYDIKEGRGYKFSCHNVDTPMQQTTLIAGLAALHDCARKEMSTTLDI